MGDGGGGHWLVRMEWRPAGWSVCLPLTVKLPLHHKVEKFSSGTGSPGWCRKKGRKTVVVVENGDLSVNSGHQGLVSEATFNCLSAVDWATTRTSTLHVCSHYN